MSSPVISIPGVGNVQFPASMTQEDINAAAKKLYTDAAAKQISANPPGMPNTTPAELQGPPDNQYKAVPEEQTPEGSSAAQAARVPDNPLDQTAAGFMKSAGQTVENTLGKILPGQGPSKEDLTADNGWQTTGGIAESVLEAVAADKAFQALGVIDKIKSLGTVSELMSKHPIIAKALGSGLLNATTGAITQGVKTGTAEGSEEGAVAGGIAGTALPLAGAAVKSVPNVWSSVTGKALQADLQTGIRSVLNDAADAAEVAKPGSPTIRDSARALANNVEGKSKSLFSAIDDATDGEATNLQRKIKNVDLKLRDVAGTDDAMEEKLTGQKDALMQRFDDVLETAKQNGVDENTIEQAKQSWKQQSALRDLDTQIKASTAGNVKNAPEVVDPNKLVPRLQKLADSGRLAEALGDEQADALLQHAYDSQKAASSRATKIKVGKYAAGLVGVGTTGGAIEHVLAARALNK